MQNWKKKIGCLITKMEAGLGLNKDHDTINSPVLVEISKVIILKQGKQRILENTARWYFILKSRWVLQKVPITNDQILCLGRILLEE